MNQECTTTDLNDDDILAANRPLLEEMAAALVERKLIAGKALDELTARVVMGVSGNEGTEVKPISTAEANSSKMPGELPQSSNFRQEPEPQDRQGPT